MYLSYAIKLSARSVLTLTVLLNTVIVVQANGQDYEPVGGLDYEARPRALAAGLTSSALKTDLLSCDTDALASNNFSIAHRGAPLGFPEHTRQGYQAAAQMGAGLIECDVTFTKDLALVCRHSQCDLHRTTNVLQTSLASQCSTPFQAAQDGQPANANCCTSDFSLQEFKQLCGRADHVNAQAESVDEYLQSPSSPVTGSISQCGTLMTHAESIELIDELGADFIPELKAPQVPMPFNGFTQVAYANKMLADYAALGITADRVHPQSFQLADVQHWLINQPEFSDQIVYLDPRGRQRDFKPALADMQSLHSQGLRVLAPPMPMLLSQNPDGDIIASDYARFAKQAGLKLVTWTFESRNPTAPENWLYANLPGFVTDQSKTFEVLDALNREAGISAMFSDWPATVTYYANCANK
jgi:glycerophosphoryl diester phosphodiesterase